MEFDIPGFIASCLFALWVGLMTGYVFGLNDSNFGVFMIILATVMAGSVTFRLIVRRK